MPTIECISPFTTKPTLARRIVNPVGSTYLSLLLNYSIASLSSAALSSNSSSKPAESRLNADGTKKKKDKDLFKAKDLSKVTYYEALSVPMNVTKDAVKSAYHKACLKYHPDKTGRGEEDAVFLLIKAAFDTLSDNDKKRSYDSSVDFDDNIPPEIVDEKDFYKVFNPVFERNMRFAVTSSMKGNKRAEARKSNKSPKSNKGSKDEQGDIAPVLGDDDSPVEEVEAFYSYWIRFESWRDFTLKASKDTSHDLDAAESREEKRWMMKEVERKCTKMKRDEVTRIATLVERAVANDPRLKRKKNAEKKEKEDAKQAKEDAETNAKNEAKDSAAEKARVEEEEEEERKLATTNTKNRKEMLKKAGRKIKNAFRKSCMTAFETGQGKDGVWETLVEMNDEVEFMTETLDVLDLIPSLTQLLGDATIDFTSMKQIRSVYTDAKDGVESEFAKSSAAKSVALREAKETERLDKLSRAPTAWAKAELSALAKGVKKYGAGGANGWESIASFVNTLLCLPEPRGKDECIAKWNEVLEEAKTARNAPAPVVVAGVPQANETAAAVVVEEVVVVVPEPVKQAPNEWNKGQDVQLEKMLKKYDNRMEKEKRWTAIANGVDGKSMKECANRFKVVRDQMKAKGKK